MKTKKLSEGFVGYFLPGIFLVTLSIGAMFSVDLVRYGFFIMLVSVVIVLYYLNSSLMAHYKNTKMKKIEIYAGFVGIILLGFFLGMQSPQLPLKILVLVIGVILVIWGFVKRKS